MAITFDGASKRIILDTASVTAAQIWSRWVDWAANSDNSKWPNAISQIGGDDLGGGLSIPPYFFLLNGWRVRPMESSHTLTITGNLFVDGGGDPVVPTLGTYNVLIRSVVPVQAQGISTSGGAVDNNAIAAAVWNESLSSHTTAGSAGKVLSDTTTGGVDLTPITSRLDALEIDVGKIRDFTEGNWQIVGNQMIFFDRADAELMRFNLFDQSNAPANKTIFRRQKV